MTDYKKVFNRLEATFPLVAQRLNPDPALKNFNELPEIQEKFIALTGFCKHDIAANKNDSRLYFVAVVIKMADPLFFEYNTRIPHRLEFFLTRLLRCSRKQISHNIKNVKNYLHVYPDFGEKVEQIYSQIIIL